jgi:ParB family chromosome partitioning protein
MSEKIDTINSTDDNDTDDDFETIIAKSLDDIAIPQDKPSDLVQDIHPNILDKTIMKNDNLVNNQYSDVDNHHNNIIHKLPIELVNPNKEQPRKFFDVNALNDLASSIKVYGVIQPILVNKIGHEYMIVAGERRWRASQIAELKTIPAIIANYKEDETLEIALIENIQRANLTPIDEAKAYYYLIHKYELTQNELAQKVGKSRSYVANMVRLLELDDNVKNYLETGELSVGHARVLIGVKNATDLADKIVKSNMSVRKVEELVSQSLQKQNVRLPKAFDAGKNTDILALEADLRAALGVGVSINSQTSQKGSLVIRYESLEQLDEVCRRLCSNWGVDVA